MRPYAWSVLVGALLALRPADAPADNVEASLVVGTTAVALPYACALQHENEEGLLAGPEMRVLVSDRSVPAQLLGRPLLSRLDHMGRAGEFRGVLICFDPRDALPTVRGALYLASDRSGAASRATPLDGSGLRSLYLEVGEDCSVRLRWAQGTITLDVDVTVPVQTNDRFVAYLRGQEAQGCPQTQAVLNYERAVAEGRLDDARARCTRERSNELAELARRGDESAFAELVAPPDLRALHVDAVYVRESQSLVIFDEEGAKSFFEVVKVGDVWKVD